MLVESIADAVDDPPVSECNDNEASSLTFDRGNLAMVVVGVPLDGGFTWPGRMGLDDVDGSGVDR